MQAIPDNAANLAAERVTGDTPNTAVPRIPTPETNPSPAQESTPTLTQPHGPAPSSTSQKPSSATANEISDADRQPLLTFHKDTAGRVYYVVTDPVTGQQIAQLPPEEIRNVSEGIAEFIKKRQAENQENPQIKIDA